MMLRRAVLAAALLPCAASFSTPWQASPWHLSRGASAACSRWSAVPLRMHSPATSVAADRRAVRGVLLEALEQQQRKKEALQDQLDKVQQAAPAALCADDADDEDVRKGSPRPRAAPSRFPSTWPRWPRWRPSWRISWPD